MNQLTHTEKTLLRLIVNKEIDSFSDPNCLLSTTYKEILSKI